MKNLLKDIQEYMEQDDGFRQRSANYSRALKTQEWEFLNHAILIIKGKMMEDMLEKDVVQRTYYNINEILDFISSPETWLKKKTKLKLAYSNIASKISRARSGG